MKLSPHLRTLLLACALFIAMGADDDWGGGCIGPDPLLEDPSFDLWCGDDLCSWELEAGHIEQAPTWHSGDHGVGMMSDPTAITQHSRATSNETHCIWFSLMVDSDPGVTVQLEMDFRDDGVAEYAHPIPSTDWTTFSYYIRPPEDFNGVRFRIRKTGSGEAVLAQILAERDDEEMCESQEPLSYQDLPLGATCTSHDECTTGVCQGIPVPGTWVEVDTAQQSCGECSLASCGDDLVCGLAYSSDNLTHSACVESDSKVLGEACMSGAECGTGVCCEGQCSECCQGGVPCDDGAACERKDGNGDAHTQVMPWMCEPDERDRGNGGACMDARDCASATCGAHEELRLCDAGGQPCATDGDCPGYNYEAGSCVSLGAYEGACQLDAWPTVP